jgi:hypothetical protein
MTVAAALLFATVSSNASAFGVTNFKFTNSDLQANGHPTMNVGFNRQGGESEDIKDVTVDLPAGVFANPEAANPKCTATQFNSDTCPASSYTGEVTAGVKALGLLDMTVHGSVNILAPAAGSTDIATVGMTLRPEKICILFIFCAVPEKIYLKTGVNIKTFDNSGLRTYTPGAPRSTVIGIPLVVWTPTLTADITMNSLSLNFNSRSGKPTTKQVCSGPWYWRTCNTVPVPPAGPYFMRQAGDCVPATAAVELVSYQGARASATSSYTPTGCEAVPHQGTNFSFTPTDTTFQTNTTAKFVMNVPQLASTIEHALPKYVDSDFPIGSGIDLDELTGVTSCSEEELQANNCPASSIVGTASAESSYIPEGLAGPMYAVGDVGNQLPIAVLLSGPRNSKVVFRGTLGVRGTVEGGDGRAYARFDRIPQLPFGKFTLNIGKKIYVNPPKCGPQTINTEITQFSGQVINRTAEYSVTNCPVIPETTITNGPPPVTTATQPAFQFSSSVAGSTFQCKIDSDPYELCSTGWVPESLTNGDHTFSVYSMNGTAPDPTPATYTFRVNTTGDFEITPEITPSTTKAGAHPDMSAIANVSGGQPKTLQIKMPRGFNASLAAVPACSTAVAAVGNCPSDTKIGTSQLTVLIFDGSPGGSTVAGTGDIFLTDAPTAADAGGASVKIEMPFGTFIAQAGAYLVNNGANQYIDIRSFPTSINGTEFTITQVQMDFEGSETGFLTNPSRCEPDSFNSTGTAFNGEIAAVETVPFEATDCDELLFDPRVTQVFSSLEANTTSKVVATVDLPEGHSAIRNMTVLEPPVFGPNYPAFGRAADKCPGGAASTTTAFNPDNCPTQSKVGTMTLETPLLSDELTGDVFLINKTPLPWFGVKIDRPGISVRLTGYTNLVQVDPNCDEETDPNGFCQKQISVKFENVPDVPITHVVFRLDSDPRPRPAPLAPLEGELIVLAEPGDTTCQASSPAKSTIDSYSGLTVNKIQNLPVTGC